MGESSCFLLKSNKIKKRELIAQLSLKTLISFVRRD